MTQEELDVLLINHRLWLDSNGESGQRANFSTSQISRSFSISSQSMWINFSQHGGVCAMGGQPYQYGKPCPDFVLSHFTELNFENADLSDAIFGDAIFYKCNMTGSRLINCDLSKAKFGQVDFKNSDFGGIGSIRAILSGGVFSGCDFEKCFLQHANFDNCNLSGSNFCNCSMPNSSFLNCLLFRTQFCAAWLSSSCFENSSARESNFEAANLSECNFSFSNLHLASFKDANFTGAEFQERRFSQRVLDAFLKQEKSRFIGCRTDGAYGNERLVRSIKDAVFIEEVKKNNPLIYKLWLITSDCGRSLSVWLFWTGFLILLFATTYSLLGVDHFAFNPSIQDKGSFLTAIYFSVVAFTTLGFGDISPITSCSMLLVILETFLGFSMLGILISIGANKISQRS